MPYPLTPVRWFHSGMADAPVLRGEAGALIELLDACLINGFSTRTLTSLSVSGGVATATISSGNPYEQYSVIRISGATPAGLNGDHRIDTSAASSFTFPAPEGVPDGAATGTITVLRSPAGWSKPFSGTNKAAYQGDEGSTQLYLRVDDTESVYSNVRGYETLTDIDTGSGLFPTVAMQANYWWNKSNAAGAAPRAWTLVADGAMLFFIPCAHSSYPNAGHLNYFGDFSAYSPADAYNCMICGHTGAKTVSVESNHLGSIINSRVVARAANGAGSAVTVSLLALQPYANYFCVYARSRPVEDAGGSVGFGPPPIVLDGTALTSGSRGSIVGLRGGLEASSLPKTPVYVGGNLLLPLNVFSYRESANQVAIDLVGPWR